MSSSHLIIGAGAVGTVLAAFLTEARRKVRLAIRETEVEALSSAPSLRIERVTGRPPLTAAKPPLTTELCPAPDETVFLCVKHRDLPSVFAGLPDTLPTGVTLIPCLNGVGIAHQLRERYPGTRVAAMTIMFNAQLLEPLHARITTRPHALINSDDPTLLKLFAGSAMKLERAEDESRAWGKLVINLASALCALTHTTFKDLLTDAHMSACFVAVLDEATAVLDAAGIAYSLPVPMPYRAYRALLLHGGPAPWWFARYRDGLTHASYPAMVADVEHGKQTEVAQLNGEIVRLSDRTSISAPINAKLVEMVQELEGKAQEYFLSPAALRKRLAP